MSVVFSFGMPEGYVAGQLTINGDSVALDMLEEDVMLSATCSLFENDAEITIPLQDEFPGESIREAARLKITKVSENRLRIRVIQFKEHEGRGLLETKGMIRYEQHCGLVTFGRAIHQGMTEYRAEVQHSGKGFFWEL